MRTIPNHHLHHFVETTPWRFAKTYAATGPHEYVVRTPENAETILRWRDTSSSTAWTAVSIRVRRYHYESGKVYWSMADAPEAAMLINRCERDQTYEARGAAGTLPTGTSSRIDRLPARRHC